MRRSTLLPRLAAVGLALGALVSFLPVTASEGATGLVRNPGCETNTAYWVGYYAALTRVTAGPHSGAASCQVAYGGTGSYYTLDDSPATVSNPTQGAVYAATAWVRTAGTAGKAVQLILRQRGGTRATRESASLAAKLGSSWAQLSVQATVDGGGRTSLEVYLVQSSPAKGDSFQADDITLVLQGAPSATATPSPTATASPTATSTASATSSPSPTQTPAPTATASPTASPTPTSSPTATPTSAPPTATATPSPTSTSGSTATTWNQQTYGGALFSSTSAWNAKATGSADPNSDTMLTHLTLSSTPFDVMLTSSAIPLYYADASTPRVWVAPSTSWWPGVQAPIPAEAQPDTGSDHHLTVWDVPNHRLYEFWEMAKGSNGAWLAGFGVTFDSGGIGYQTGLWQGSARESGVSLAGGLIRYGEMKNGLIPHALAMSYPYTRGDAYARGMGPGGVMAVASQTNTGTTAKGYVGWGYLPEGGRFRLKASVDVNARCGANRACQVIGTALQQYGAYVVDTGGWPCFYAEGLDGKQVSWSGLLSATDTNLWKTADFEVLALPTLTANPVSPAP